jgi:hypothetical protein
MSIHDIKSIIGALALIAFAMPLGAARAQEAKPEPVDNFGLDAALNVLYGDWDYGDYDLDSRLGMVGLAAEVWFFQKRLGVGGNYISGDFDGEDVVSLEGTILSDPDEDYGSRKQMTHAQSREDIYVYAMWKALPFLILEAGYKYLDYDFRSDVDLVSDARLYGNGMETQRSQSKGLIVGLRAPVEFADHWTISLAGRWMPDLQTEVQGSYVYDLPLEDRTIDEDWTHNGTAEGVNAEAVLEYQVPGEPIVLQLGYVYQWTDSTSDVERSWVDQGLGQPARDWLSDRFQGGVVGVKFRF